VHGGVCAWYLHPKSQETIYTSTLCVQRVLHVCVLRVCLCVAVGVVFRSVLQWATVMKGGEVSVVV